jgi:uncharacterized protein (DUF433 family)
MPETAYPHITIDPNVCGGLPCIGGRRLRVYDVAAAYELEGLSVEEICAMYPGLTLAEAHAALTYFYDHRDETLAEADREEAAITEYQRQLPGQTVSQMVPCWISG